MTRRLNPPPLRCRAVSKRTGEPCRRWAQPGQPQGLCWSHGGATDGRAGKESARAKQGANETFVRLLEHSPRRNPWAVVLDAVHLADTAMRDEWQRVVDADELTAEQLARLLEAGRFAHGMAASAITARAQELRSVAQKARIDDLWSKLEAVFKAAFAELDHTDLRLSWDQKLAVEDAFYSYFERTRHPAALEIEAAVADESMTVQADTNGDGR